MQEEERSDRQYARVDLEELPQVAVENNRLLVDIDSLPKNGEWDLLAGISDRCEEKGGLLICIAPDRMVMDRLLSEDFVAVPTVGEAYDYMMMDELEKELLDDEE